MYTWRKQSTYTANLMVNTLFIAFTTVLSKGVNWLLSLTHQAYKSHNDKSFTRGDVPTS